MVGAPDRVFIMLDDDERVALGLEFRKRVEQDAVVARMQADRRLVEHIAHPLQVRAELRREPDALGLAARERRRRAIEREIAQPDIVQKAQNARRASVRMSRAISASRPVRPSPLNCSATSPTDRAVIAAIDSPRKSTFNAI